MKLNDNPLPWVSELVHLGTKITNEVNGCQKDIVEKKARYIDRACNLNQEFGFCHPLTKFKVNEVYNTHFYSSQLWDMFGQEFQKFESSYNRSIKIYADLPLQTHRNLIEPVSALPHMKVKVIRNYLNFIDTIRSSEKSIV